MTRISMKALLGASSLAVIAAILPPPAAHAQAQSQPNYMTAAPQQPGTMPPAGMAPAPQQNAYAPPQADTNAPIQFRQTDVRYPGPKLN